MAGALVCCYPTATSRSHRRGPARRVARAVPTATSRLHPRCRWSTRCRRPTRREIIGDGCASTTRPSASSADLERGVRAGAEPRRSSVAEIENHRVYQPYFKEQVDDRWDQLAARRRDSSPMQPSCLIEEHFSFTYITDHYGIHNRDAVGVDRILWSSDYPHAGSDWPNSCGGRSTPTSRRRPGRPGSDHRRQRRRALRVRERLTRSPPSRPAALCSSSG